MIAGRFSPSIGLVGVDFGTRSIKLLQLRQHGRQPQAVGAARLDIQRTPSTPEDRASLTEQLRGAFSVGGFTGRRCVVSLPRCDVRVQSVRLPKMPDEELRQAAVWEAAQRFGFERASMEVDVIRTGAEMHGSEDRQEVLLIATSHDTINAWIEPLLAAGLRPVAIETHFMAQARVFGQREVPGITPPARAVVDVGASGSTVMILRGDQVSFCKPIAFGGEQMDQAVAEHLQMERAAARELRAARIAAANREPSAQPITDSSIDRAVYDAVRPLFGSFAKEVMLCISYFGVAFRGHPPKELVLTGGDGLEPKLAETLALQCQVTVVLDEDASPMCALTRRIQAILHRASGPAAWWTVAAGLSLRGISKRGLAHMRSPSSGLEAA